jgi:hypothetical protein
MEYQGITEGEPLLKVIREVEGLYFGYHARM